jgi:hypothetical protein
MRRLMKTGKAARAVAAVVLAVAAVSVTAVQASGQEADAPSRACVGTGTTTVFLSSPVRLVDSRAGLGLPGPLQPDRPVTVEAGGLGENAVALVANVTVANPAAGASCRPGPPVSARRHPP